MGGCQIIPFQAEKEAKRLRRVLANRESARQTILRRQVCTRDDGPIDPALAS
jgi:hypothetical protein